MSCTAFAIQLSNRLEISVKAEILSALIEIDQIYHRRIDSYNKHHQCCKYGENVQYRDKRHNKTHCHDYKAGLVYIPHMVAFICKTIVLHVPQQIAC